MLRISTEAVKSKLCNVRVYTAFHRTVNWSMRKFPAMRKFGIRADDLLGYEKPNDTQKWWLDLERVNGVLHVPTKEKGKELYIQPEKPEDK